MKLLLIKLGLNEPESIATQTPSNKNMTIFSII